MVGRRDFLKQSMAVAAVAPAGALAATDAVRAGNRPVLNRPALIRIDFVLVDEQFDDSVAFGDELARHGAQVFSLREDIGRLWFGDLGRAYDRGKRIAGLTTHTELMICGSFVWQRGARVRYEAEHDCRGANFITHSIHRGVTAQTLTALQNAGVDWPRTLASHLMDTRTVDDTTCNERCTTSTLRNPTHPGSLFSWVIA